MLPLSVQIIYLFLLAIPVACIAWTMTHEEITREPREYCIRKSKYARSLMVRKLFYLFTCEYCFSHYVTLFFVIVTGFQMLYPNWMGYVISFFSIVWVANIYMSLYGRVRVEMKAERIEAKIKEAEYEETRQDAEEEVT